MTRAIIFTLFCIALLFDRFALTQESTQPHIEYVRYFLAAYPARMERALALMPVVEGYSAIHEIDPLIPSVVISCESSWKSKSKNGRDTGLMQVRKGGVCSRGFDLSVPEQQIAAGIACLASARDACDGSLRQMLTMYQSGSCTARTPTTRRRITNRIRIIERWSK